MGKKHSVVNLKKLEMKLLNVTQGHYTEVSSLLQSSPDKKFVKKRQLRCSSLKFVVPPKALLTDSDCVINLYE